MRIFAIALFFIYSGLAYSTIDGSLAAFYRNKPVAGGGSLNMGYNQLVWGDASMKPLYGFVRPNLTAFSAGQYNAYTYEIEFYPISFIGVEYGKESISNTGIYQDYDCETFQCQKDFSNQYLKFNLLLGYNIFFFKGTIHKQTLKADIADKDFIYPNIGSALHAGEDKIESREITLGLNLGFYDLIYQDKKSEIEVRKNVHRNRAILLGLKTTPIKTYLSVGRFQSHEVPDSTYAAVAFTTNFGSTLKLD